MRIVYELDKVKAREPILIGEVSKDKSKGYYRLVNYTRDIAKAHKFRSDSTAREMLINDLIAKNPSKYYLMVDNPLGSKMQSKLNSFNVRRGRHIINLALSTVITNANLIPNHLIQDGINYDIVYWNSNGLNIHNLDIYFELSTKMEVMPYVYFNNTKYYMKSLVSTNKILESILIASRQEVLK